jgi:hypothetical protein
MVSVPTLARAPSPQPALSTPSMQPVPVQPSSPTQMALLRPGSQPVIQVATPEIEPVPGSLAAVLSFEKPMEKPAAGPSAAPTTASDEKLDPQSNAAVVAANVPMVTVPPLAPRGAVPGGQFGAPATAAPSGAVPVIEFGQPLPGTAQPNAVSPSQMPSSQAGVPQAGVIQSGVTQAGVIQAGVPVAPPSVLVAAGGMGVALLPAGTLLNLRYPGPEGLSLRSAPDRQEVLLLQTEVRDALGRVLIPANSLVTGRFETSAAGSRFITQSISLQGRSVPLRAESGSLMGDRAINNSNLAINSGIGALAGGVLGEGSGVAAVGGAAVGAAVTYLTSPRPATILPGQMVQVRLIEDLR